ncbi:recombinase family protein, partial [Ruania rhizosphaerae]|uniref:recombinase family protein n=1 Tax=Ruania rhizosphaerae TaxID=1840413 RepID=UPI0013570330
MSPGAARRCVVYARISITSEESVSIERQIEAGEQYAAAQGWQVVGTFTDEGVSATANRPVDREGWRALLASPEPYDVVIVWKVDRLARRITDFWASVAALQEQDRALVAVKDSLDMTTATGRTFAGLIAGFAEMEAEAISLRVRAARGHLLRAGRVVGGTVPYGWRNVPNPDGDGKVLSRDPERIEYVRGMVQRAQRGDTIYSVVQWLNESNAPLPRASQTHRKREGWRYKTVEDLLRNPVLAGMTAYTPGNAGKSRGSEVLR